MQHSDATVIQDPQFWDLNEAPVSMLQHILRYAPYVANRTARRPLPLVRI